MAGHGLLDRRSKTFERFLMNGVVSCLRGLLRSVRTGLFSLLERIQGPLFRNTTSSHKAPHPPFAIDHASQFSLPFHRFGARLCLPLLSSQTATRGSTLSHSFCKMLEPDRANAASPSLFFHRRSIVYQPLSFRCFQRCLVPQRPSLIRLSLIFYTQ